MIREVIDCKNKALRARVEVLHGRVKEELNEEKAFEPSFARDKGTSPEVSG